MSSFEPRSVREGVIEGITERQWLALAGLLARARERPDPVGDLSRTEVEDLQDALKALSGGQDIEHGLRDEEAFFRKYPHLVPPWRRGS